MSYSIQRSVSGEFDQIVETTIDALQDEGFGVLCDIDVQATFEEKLGESFRQYRILGVCNPALAQEALTEEIELGALLPCNVIVYETNHGEITVSSVDPTQLVGITGTEALESVATGVHDRFERVLAAVAEASESPAEA